MNNISYNIELECDKNTKKSINSILVQQRDIVNSISNIFNENNIPSVNIKTIHDLSYQELKNKYPNAFSQILIKSEQEFIANYKAIKSNKHKNHHKVEKKNLSLRLDKRLYSSFTQESIRISINKGRKTELKFKLFDKVIDLFSKYQTCDPLIFIKKDRIFLNVTFQIPEINRKDNSTLGVDLGMRRLYTDSDGNCLKSTEYLRTKRKIRYNKRTLQSKKTKSSKKKLKEIRRKERNFSKNYQYLVANNILKTNKSIIVIEDLSKIKKKKNEYQKINAKSQIPFYGLRNILTYKAMLLGKEVVTVNPKNTSRDDCRKLPQGERKGCRYYGVDGVILDADGNAACNIALRHNSNHPISLSTILDGNLSLVGRLCVNQPIVEGFLSLSTSSRL